MHWHRPDVSSGMVMVYPEGGAHCGDSWGRLGITRCNSRLDPGRHFMLEPSRGALAQFDRSGKHSACHPAVNFGPA